MSVTTRIQELNNRLATNLVSKGVSAEGTETTTELINKVNDIESGGTSVINPEWTDWRYFSYYNNRNDLVAKLKYSDTANGTDFSNMFYYCTSLTSIPQLSTSNGKNFSFMFYSCTALTSIPQLDTSNGTDFNRMFLSCTKLHTIPLLNMSNGKNFSQMFNGCYALTSIPQLDISNGTDFSGMFNSCTALTSIPQLDTSNGKNFSFMFYNCTALTSIPQLDTSNGTNFGYMFNGCRALTTIPLLNMSNVSGTSWSNMFYNCTALENETFEGTIPVRGNMSVFSYSNKLTVKSLMSFINALTNMSDTATYTITIGSTNLAKLTEEQIQIATDKRITLQ